MVTYYCAICASTLTKKQGMEHGYCGFTFTCVSCREEVKGKGMAKSHHCDPNVQSKKPKLVMKSNVLDLSGVKWNGFKNTLRRVVKIQKPRRVNKKLLKQSFLLLYLGNSLPRHAYDKSFEEKLRKAKNLSEEGEFVVYNK